MDTFRETERDVVQEAQSRVDTLYQKGKKIIQQAICMVCLVHLMGVAYLLVIQHAVLQGRSTGFELAIGVVVGGAVLDLGILYLVYRGIGLMRTIYIILAVLSLLVNLFSLPEFMMELDLPGWLVLFYLASRGIYIGALVMLCSGSVTFYLGQREGGARTVISKRVR